ncbi:MULTISPECIES: phasin family protein [Ramlibacter]|uniref:Poly granule associated protein n=1 Tax=Ramlibacter pinisoli TaxID=2682844 RepID=A0A6N8ISD1_9BURK|nr:MULTISPECIES: phasin family protein [Ramlibacter]MBA2964846.1 phasin family protein [Ramlibacter sp. CGMCC 1.13660]MVQ29811.1 poly granule associated protein [Ramlibacter pinisoli]
MVKKTTSGTDDSADPTGSAQFAGTVKDSASKIWLAGLGAFAKAQEEGGKVFETLVKEGLSIQRKTQAAAGERLNEATSRMASMATGFTSRTSGQWDKLETIFEERVAKSLNRLGVPSARDVEALQARIDELQRTVDRLSARSVGKSAPAAGGAAKSTARKRPVRKTAKPPA